MFIIVELCHLLLFMFLKLAIVVYANCSTTCHSLPRW